MSFWFYVYQGEEISENELFADSITWNLNPMWYAAGVHDALRKSDGKKANEIDEALVAGLRRMRADPETFRKMNPPNGWGTYEQAMKLLEELIRVVQSYPEATIRISG